MTKRSTDFSEQSWWGMQNLEWFASTKVRTDYFSIESALIVFSTTSADGEYIRFAVLSSSWNCEEIVEERATLGCAKKSSRELEDSLITRRFQAHLHRSRIRNWDAFHFKKSSSLQSIPFSWEKVICELSPSFEYLFLQRLLWLKNLILMPLTGMISATRASDHIRTVLCVLSP